jgi:hypothetical protein
MSCDHPLVDVWGDSRAPFATEVTKEEAEQIVSVDRVSRYMQCADPKCGLEVE